MKTLNEADLNQFTGTEHYYKHWTGQLVYTDGVQYVAENGGAFWLIDAIASWQTDPKVQKNERLQEFQLWTLKVRGGSATLTCQEDSGEPNVVTQNIEFTDFPLPEIQFYVEPLGGGKGCLLLRSEH